MTDEDQTDQLRDLVAAAKAGDATAMHLLIRHYAPIILALARRYAAAVNWEPEDLAQEAWIKIVKGLANYTEQGKFDQWIATVVTNVFLNRLDWEKRRPRLVPSEDEQPSNESADWTSRAELRAWLAVLPRELAVVTVLRGALGWTWEHVAFEMQALFPEGSWTASRCRRRYRDALMVGARDFRDEEEA